MQIPQWLRKSLVKWADGVIAGREPDVMIERTKNPGEENLVLRPYLHRWHILPRNRVMNIYLHRFFDGDPDDELHDHPWPNVSVLLQGEYMEKTPSAPQGVFWRKEGFFYARRATDSHRVILFKNIKNEPLPVTTLFLTGPRIREWGFWCKNKDGSPRWVHWEKYVNNVGKHSFKGAGCGDG